MDLIVNLKTPHPKQAEFINTKAKRLVVRAARRGGKTTGIAILAVIRLLEGRRILYATPTQEQIGKFWWEVTTAMKPAIDAGLYYKNETEHVIRPTQGKSEARIRAKTAWNANTLRGDYADLLILDEYQLMDPDVWARVGAPMLLDNDGDAVFIYTPEQTALHASQLYKKARQLQRAAEEVGEQPRWQVFHWTSLDNPHLSSTALEEITSDMSALNYRLEILAEDIDDDPRALWNRELLHKTRVLGTPELERIVVAVDPPGSAEGEAGIIVAGSAWKGDVLHGYVLEDGSIQGSPATWAGQAIALYNKYAADRLVAERNFGGDMVENTFKSVDPTLPVKLLTASRGKIARAEPIEALYEKGRVHHVGEFPVLEQEMCLGGETKVITRTGPVCIGELVDKEVVVLGGDGEWHHATGGYYGRQQVYRITVSRSKGEQELVATANHDWYVGLPASHCRNYKNSMIKTKTRDLKDGDYLTARVRRSLLSHAHLDTSGVMAGFVFGDGWIMDKELDTSACGVTFYEHDGDVIPWFGPAEVQNRLRPFQTEYGTFGSKLYGLPRFLKQPPNYMESASYLYGWLAGYFAADGHITKRGQCSIASANREHLEIARHVAVILGIGTGPISEFTRSNYGCIRKHYIPFAGKLYTFTLTAGTLRPEFFIKQYHRERWIACQENGFRDRTWRWRVDHIEPVNTPCDVFCLTVPDDHRFVLAETNIISGNCQYHFTLNKGTPSPNHMDAAVWALTELMLDYCATELGSIEFPML